MKIHVDVSGQITQKNLHSVIGMQREDGLKYSVFLRNFDKKAIIKKYKGQITRLIEKLHCILIYYCIRDHLNGVSKLIICRDVNFRILKNLLPLIFKNNLKNIKILQRESNSAKSKAHYTALKTFRHRKYADFLISKEMIEQQLFEFKSV